MKRNIQLTLEEARNLYNSGNSDIKSLILTSFTEAELTDEKWRDIKTFEDVCNKLNIDSNYFITIYQENTHILNYNLNNIYKINLIIKALNEGWIPDYTRDRIYFPLIKFIKCKSTDNIDTKNQCVFKYKDRIYIVICNTYASSSGLSSLFEDELCNPNTGLFGCKSPKIALHMGKYFTKEIFLACYSNILKIEWL